MVNDEAAGVSAPASLDSVQVAFDDRRSVADAGLILAGTLAERLGLERLINRWVDLGGRPGAFRPGRKVMTLVHAILAGADSTEDCDLLRSGSRGNVLGHRVMAASTGGSCAPSASVTSDSSTGAGRGACPCLEDRGRPGHLSPGDRRRLVRRRGPRQAQAGRRLRLHQGARLSPAAGLPGQDRRGLARAKPQGVGQHPARRRALHPGARRAGQASRGRRRDPAARRLRVGSWPPPWATCGQRQRRSA